MSKHTRRDFIARSTAVGMAALGAEGLTATCAEQPQAMPIWPLPNGRGKASRMPTR